MHAKITALVLAAALTGCASEPGAIRINKGVKQLTLDGEEIWVSPLPDAPGTFGAIGNPRLTRQNAITAKARYEQAIEQATGCKVVAAQYEPTLDYVHAQVDCSSQRPPAAGNPPPPPPIGGK